MNLRSSRGALMALGIAGALAAGLAPIVSSAQPAPQQLPANPQPDRGVPPADRGDPSGFDRRADRFEDRLERRLDFLRSELRITPAQEQAWTAFADAVRREAETGRDQFRDRRDEFRGGPDGRFEPPGIVERLERRQQRVEERSAHYDRLLSALRPLYAQLSDEQRRAADENLFSPGRGDRGDRRRGGPRRFSMDRGEYSTGMVRPFERSYGPFDPPYYRFNGPY